MARIGIDLKLFELLAASDNPMTLDQLQQKTGAAPILLGRLLRYLSSKGMIKEVRLNTFGPTSVTRALAIPGIQAGLLHGFDTLGPVYQELPNFLADTMYQDMTDSAKTAWQPAWKTEEPVFLWMEKHQQNASNFNQWMAHRRKDMATWLSVFPVEQEFKGTSTKHDVLFVDIGGNIGHQCAEFRAKYPNLQGRVILQDLPHAIDMALRTPGVENTVHDMFTPQPVKDAKFYYIRAVLHDFPDDKCRLVLKNLGAAMGKDSMILIDEMILPDWKIHWHSTQVDLTMMAALAAIERTREQWTSLLDSAGLKILNTYTYTPSVYESVMAVVHK